MHIVSIEPTPSPNSMKINVSESLPEGESENYKANDNIQDAPSYIKKLFQIEGVKGIYRVIDFIALERNPRVAWESILPEVRKVFGNTINSESNQKKTVVDNSFGEIKVYLQMFRDIPMQVKLDDGTEEHRVALPELFSNAVMEASSTTPHFVMERKWVEVRPRYGLVGEVATEIVDELSASYDEERLKQLVQQALHNTSNINEVSDEKLINLEVFDHPDWKVRYAALDRLREPSYEHLPVLDKALQDPKGSIRRLATAYLGMIEEPEVLPYLYQALKDKAVTVRRTAGDCLSDLGFKQAIPEMIQSLSDENRLVRWRAAMFLYEVGDESALPALYDAVDDPEFEVRMQVKMAIERIEGGEEAKGSVWHQMTQATKNNSN